MTVSQLIEKLNDFPGKLPVRIQYDMLFITKELLNVEGKMHDRPYVLLVTEEEVRSRDWKAEGSENE